MERFWNKVIKTESCWNWIGAKTSFGHGRFKLNGKLVSPHRLVYEWEYGNIPEGYDICHHCDNPACVNPKHLFAGTRSDNMKDAANKGRIYKVPKEKLARGEKVGGSKLTEQIVRQIRKEYVPGKVTYDDLAEKYGVHKKNIMRAIKGKQWAHVK